MYFYSRGQCERPSCGANTGATIGGAAGGFLIGAWVGWSTAGASEEQARNGRGDMMGRRLAAPRLKQLNLSTALHPWSPSQP